MENKMPLIRSLLIKGGEPLPDGFEELLEDAGVAIVSIDELDDEQLGALVSMAEEAASDGTLDAAFKKNVAGAGGAYGGHVEEEETLEDEAAETPEEQAAEYAAGTEQHSTEEFVDMAEDTTEKVESLVEEIEDVAIEVSDPSTVEDLVVQARGLLTACKDAVDETKIALQEDDIQAAASAAAQCNEALETVKDILAQAKEASSEEESDPEEANGGKNGRGSSDATTPPKVEPSEAPLVTWATMAAKGCKF
jgi:hypothetical protein